MIPYKGLPRLKSMRTAAVLILLIAAGVTGNFFSMPLFLGVDFLFGSLAVLIVVGLYGTIWGTAAAVVIGSCTGIFLHYPTAFILYPLEALVVGLLLQRENENLILADGFFWLFIGIPLGWLYHYGLLNMDTTLTLLITLKQSVNGIFNALLASLMITHLPVRRWVGLGPTNRAGAKITLHQMLFNLLVAFVLIPALLFLSLHNQREQREMEADIQSRIDSASTEIINNLQTWLEQHQHAVTELARIAAGSDMKPSDKLQKSTEDIMAALPDFTVMYIGNAAGTSIAFCPPTDARGASTVGLNFADRDYFKDVKANLKPGTSSVFVGRANVAPYPLVTLTVPVLTGKDFRGYALGALNLKNISKILRLSSHDETIQLTILDRNEKVIASSIPDLKPMQSFDHKAGGELRPLDANTYQWLPPAEKYLPEAARRQNSFYLRKIPIGNDFPWTLVIAAPAAPYYSELQVSNIKDLIGMLVLSIVALLFASAVSRRLVEPLSKLALVTTNLPVKLFLHQKIDWPTSSITEMDSLVGNFQSMAGTLQQNFAELQTAIQKTDDEKNKLEAIIAGIGDGISIQDKDFRILYQNEIFKALVGDHVGEYCYKAYANRDRVCKGCLVAESFKDGNIHTAEQRMITGRGKISVEITTSPLKDSSGETISAIEVIRDITDRKQAEAALRKQKERLREQLSFEYALNRMAEAVVTNDETQSILETMANIAGETLETDRVMIYDVNLEQHLATRLCGWLNPELPDVAPLQDSFDLGKFSSSNRYILKHRLWLQSHADSINPLIVNDGSAELLHKLMGIQSLLWYPFSFHANGYYLLIFNQVSHRRSWRKEELEFLDAVAKQVEIAVQKIRLLDERKQAEQLIWQEKERALVTLHSIGDAVITTDAAGRVEYLNPVAEDLTGWTNAEARGLPLLEVFHIVNENTGTIIENPVEICIREGRIVGLANHTMLVHRDGHNFAIEDSASPIKDRAGRIIGAILVFHDVSEKRAMLQQLIHQAHHDPLTNLPNRILFNDRLTLELAHAHRNNEMMAVMFLDLDHFKLVNDMVGHAMGDHLLRSVAERLMACVRESDTVSRMGGDEFTLLLPRISHAEDVAKIAQKILDALQQPWIFSGQEFQVTTSIGIALYPNDGEDADTLLKHADTAMYRAKEQGRNNYQLFTPAMNTKILERLALETSLRHALKRNEFIVYYQPQVNTDNRQVIGMEALVRWQHPERGLVFPDQFIPLAEETGLIVPIGEWVLRTACAQTKAWQEQGLPPVRVTVNISPCQFKQKNLAEKVAKVLEETGLDPGCLELEITESITMQDVDFTIATLRELRKMGIRIAIDDFGTGYSSLNYLKRFPIHTLKIDRSFVRDITTNPEDAAIVATVIVLAENLHLKVIAEGVETEEQHDFLREKHCVEMQGYLFSKPVSPGEFEKLLAQ